MRALAFHCKGLVALGAMAFLLAGCTSSIHRAPVEQRVGGAPATPPSAPVAAVPAEAGAASGAAGAVAAKPPPPGIENAGKPGYYTVKPGDTLLHIALDAGHNWRDIARWNNIDNANMIEVGQVLRVVAPNVDPNVPATRSIASSRVEARPLEAGKPAAPATGSMPAVASSPAPAPSPPVQLASVGSTSAPKERGDGDDDMNWAWPASGTVAAPFDETRSKGLSILGKPGDPVLAAADGRVVYAGSGLRGYGNLVIVKHNNTYLTAYAHNQSLLVKEDQVVHRGQKIAEMGSTDAQRVQLHFEIRKLGKPIDPSKLLPPR